MNCQKFETVVNDIARDQIIDAAARAEALRHSDECGDCAERLADELTITTHLRAFAASTEPSGASALVEASLLAAFSQRSAVKDQQSKTASPSRVVSVLHRRYWAAAIAAGLFLVFGFAAIVRRETAQPTFGKSVPGAEAGSSFAITIGLPGYPSSKDIEKIPGALASRRKSATKHNVPSSPNPQSDIAANTEIATDFLPISYGSTVNLQDGGQMVRVELPRSAMASFGLPVNMDRANEKVKADVLLGVDGLAHAIRFVR
ncbi:MAG: hypothetical protein QOK48_2667 [Blastocatellia bacterium]|jgi:hypothetical protein|nr:hypothetical protein [Blastocatellia bacterium]